MKHAVRAVFLGLVLAGMLTAQTRAADTPEVCARYDPQEHEECLVRYVDSLEQASITGCAEGRATKLRLRGEDPISARNKYLQVCRDDLAEELKAKRPEAINNARKRLASRVETRQRITEVGARVAECANNVGVELAKSTATLTEIAELSLVRCGEVLSEVYRLEAFKDDRDARSDIRDDFKRRAMNAAFEARSTK